jgi:hypothetical protein
MMPSAERATLQDILTAVDEVLTGAEEAKQLLGAVPETPDAFSRLDLVQWTAGRALLKCVEQVQDLLGKALRLVLTLEQVDVVGWSPRAIADRAETLSIINSSERWSALARLRNQLVHEYPLPRLQQYARFCEAWTAADDLRGIARDITRYAERYLDQRSS